ncbi:hypothetical protein LC593_01515 [Nostoc sp. CHAB 5844]|nr:hypothetical protein [Nostoc sp. CHAB 5844]
MENVIVIASNSFSNMDFLPPTPLMIDCCCWKFIKKEKSLNGGNLRSVFAGRRFLTRSFIYWDIRLNLVCPERLANL